MVVIMKPGTEQADIRKLAAKFEAKNLKVGITQGVGCTILGLVGDTVALDEDEIMLNEHVERVMRVQEPYKKANRKFHPEDTVVDVNGIKVGGGNFAVMAGPCSVESEEQIISIAKDVSASRRGLAARRRLQTPHQPLFLPGPRRGRPEAAAGSQGGDRYAHRH